MTKDELVATLLLLGFRQGVFPSAKNKYFKAFYPKKGVPTYVNVRVSKKAGSVQVNFRKLRNSWRSRPASTPEAALRFIEQRFLSNGD